MQTRQKTTDTRQREGKNQNKPLVLTRPKSNVDTTPVTLKISPAVTPASIPKNKTRNSRRQRGGQNTRRSKSIPSPNPNLATANSRTKPQAKPQPKPQPKPNQTANKSSPSKQRNNNPRNKKAFLNPPKTRPKPPSQNRSPAQPVAILNGGTSFPTKQAIKRLTLTRSSSSSARKKRNSNRNGNGNRNKRALSPAKESSAANPNNIKNNSQSNTNRNRTSSTANRRNPNGNGKKGVSPAKEDPIPSVDLTTDSPNPLNAPKRRRRRNNNNNNNTNTKRDNNASSSSSNAPLPSSNATLPPTPRIINSNAREKDIEKRMKAARDGQKATIGTFQSQGRKIAMARTRERENDREQRSQHLSAAKRAENQNKAKKAQQTKDKTTAGTKKKRPISRPNRDNSNTSKSKRKSAAKGKKGPVSNYTVPNFNCEKEADATKLSACDDKELAKEKFFRCISDSNVCHQPGIKVGTVEKLNKMGIGYNPIKKKFWLTWVKNNCTIKQYGHLVHTKLRKRKTYCRKTLKKTEAEIVKDEVCVNYYAILATPEVMEVTPPGGWSKPERKPRGTTTTRAKKKSTPPRSLSPPAARKKLLNDQKTKASRFGPLRIRVPAPRKRQPPKQPQRQKRRAKPRAGKSKKNNATLILQRPRDGEEKEKEKEKENDREGEESDADEENIEKHGAFVIDPKKDGKEGPSLVGGGHQKDVHEYIATVSDSESEVDDDPSSDYHPTDEDSSRESAFGELMNVNEMMDALGGSTLKSASPSLAAPGPLAIPQVAVGNGQASLPPPPAAEQLQLPPVSSGQISMPLNLQQYHPETHMDGLNLTKAMFDDQSSLSNFVSIAPNFVSQEEKLTSKQKERIEYLVKYLEREIVERCNECIRQPKYQHPENLDNVTLPELILKLVKDDIYMVDEAYTKRALLVEYRRLLGSFHSEDATGPRKQIWDRCWLLLMIAMHFESLCHLNHNNRGLEPSHCTNWVFKEMSEAHDLILAIHDDKRYLTSVRNVIKEAGRHGKVVAKKVLTTTPSIAIAHKSYYNAYLNKVHTLFDIKPGQFRKALEPAILHNQTTGCQHTLHEFRDFVFAKYPEYAKREKELRDGFVDSHIMTNLFAHLIAHNKIKREGPKIKLGAKVREIVHHLITAELKADVEMGWDGYLKHWFLLLHFMSPKQLIHELEFFVVEICGERREILRNGIFDEDGNLRRDSFSHLHAMLHSSLVNMGDKGSIPKPKARHDRPTHSGGESLRWLKEFAVPKEEEGKENSGGASEKMEVDDDDDDEERQTLDVSKIITGVRNRPNKGAWAEPPVISMRSFVPNMHPEVVEGRMKIISSIFGHHLGFAQALMRVSDHPITNEILKYAFNPMEKMVLDYHRRAVAWRKDRGNTQLAGENKKDEMEMAISPSIGNGNRKTPVKEAYCKFPGYGKSGRDKIMGQVILLRHVVTNLIGKDNSPLWAGDDRVKKANETDRQILQELQNLNIEAYNQIAHMTHEQFDDFAEAQVANGAWNEWSEWYSSEITGEDDCPTLLHLPTLNPNQTRIAKEKWLRLAGEFHDLLAEHKKHSEYHQFHGKKGSDSSVLLVECTKQLEKVERELITMYNKPVAEVPYPEIAVAIRQFTSDNFAHEWVKWKDTPMATNLVNSLVMDWNPDFDMSMVDLNKINHHKLLAVMCTRYWVPSKTGLGEVEDWKKTRRDSLASVREEANNLLASGVGDGTGPLRMAYSARLDADNELLRMSAGEREKDSDTPYYKKLIKDSIYTLLAVVFGTHLLNMIAWKVAKNHPLRVEAATTADSHLFPASDTFDYSIPIAKAAGSRAFVKILLHCFDITSQCSKKDTDYIATGREHLSQRARTLGQLLDEKFLPTQATNKPTKESNRNPGKTNDVRQSVGMWEIKSHLVNMIQSTKYMEALSDETSGYTFYRIFKNCDLFLVGQMVNVYLKNHAYFWSTRYILQDIALHRNEVFGGPFTKDLEVVKMKTGAYYKSHTREMFLENTSSETDGYDTNDPRIAAAILYSKRWAGKPFHHKFEMMERQSKSHAALKRLEGSRVPNANGLQSIVSDYVGREVSSMDFAAVFTGHGKDLCHPSDEVTIRTQFNDENIAILSKRAEEGYCDLEFIDVARKSVAKVRLACERLMKCIAKESAGQNENGQNKTRHSVGSLSLSFSMDDSDGSDSSDYDGDEKMSAPKTKTTGDAWRKLLREPWNQDCDEELALTKTQRNFIAKVMLDDQTRDVLKKKLLWMRRALKRIFDAAGVGTQLEGILSGQMLNSWSNELLGVTISGLGLMYPAKSPAFNVQSASIVAGYKKLVEPMAKLWKALPSTKSDFQNMKLFGVYHGFLDKVYGKEDIKLIQNWLAKNANLGLDKEMGEALSRFIYGDLSNAAETSVIAKEFVLLFQLITDWGKDELAIAETIMAQIANGFEAATANCVIGDESYKRFEKWVEWVKPEEIPLEMAILLERLSQSFFKIVIFGAILFRFLLPFILWNNIDNHTVTLSASIWKSLVNSLKALDLDERYTTDTIARSLLTDIPHLAMFRKPLLGREASLFIDTCSRVVRWNVRGFVDAHDKALARDNRKEIIAKWKGGYYTSQPIVGGKTKKKEKKRATFFECVTRKVNRSISLSIDLLRSNVGTLCDLVNSTKPNPQLKTWPAISQAKNNKDNLPKYQIPNSRIVQKLRKGILTPPWRKVRKRPLSGDSDFNNSERDDSETDDDGFGARRRKRRENVNSNSTVTFNKEKYMQGADGTEETMDMGSPSDDVFRKRGKKGGRRKRRNAPAPQNQQTEEEDEEDVIMEEVKEIMESETPGNDVPPAVQTTPPPPHSPNQNENDEDENMHLKPNELMISTPEKVVRNTNVGQGDDFIPLTQPNPDESGDGENDYKINESIPMAPLDGGEEDDDEQIEHTHGGREDMSGSEQESPRLSGESGSGNENGLSQEYDDDGEEEGDENENPDDGDDQNETEHFQGSFDDNESTFGDDEDEGEEGETEEFDIFGADPDQTNEDAPGHNAEGRKRNWTTMNREKTKKTSDDEEDDKDIKPPAKKVQRTTRESQPSKYLPVNTTYPSFESDESDVEEEFSQIGR